LGADNLRCSFFCDEGKAGVVPVSHVAHPDDGVGRCLRGDDMTAQRLGITMSLAS
jgi:hypothetical protein